MYDKKVLRFIKMLNLLDSRQDVITSEMAREFNVSVRTIQRDLEWLLGAGFPIDMIEPGQYRFFEGFGLKRIKITDKEAAVLTVMKEMCGSLGKDFEESFQRIFSRVLRDDFDTPYSIKIPATRAQSSPFLAILEEAISTQRIVKLMYLKAQEKRDYLGSPLKIIFLDGFWYLCFQTEKKHLIKFRLDHIKNIELTGKTFTINRNLAKEIEQISNPWYGEKESQSVVQLRVAAEVAEYFEARHYFPNQRVIKSFSDGGLLIEATISREMEVIPAILYWIPHVRVIKPATLKASVDKRIRAYLESDN